MSVKVFLNEDEIPRQWYNIAADLPEQPSPSDHAEETGLPAELG